MAMTANVSVKLDAEAARIYKSASKEDQKKIEILLSLWMREFGAPSKPLKDLMDEISDKAQKRGLTPEILEALLDDK